MNNFSEGEIEKVVYDILKRSKSFDVFPTPVDSIVKFSELYLDTSTGIHSIPNHFISKKIDVLQSALRKVFGVLDRKEKTIYIDPTQANSKKNFVKLHEVGHNVLPWQRDTSEFVDDDFTLNPEVEEQFERQANYFASAALFQLDRYDEEQRKLPLEIGSAIALADKFGGSYHASMRRYVEYSKKRCALLILNKPDLISVQSELGYKYHLQSKSFTNEFGRIIFPEKLGKDFPFMEDFLGKKNPHQKGKIQIETKNGLEKFKYHYFNNHYNVFILLMPPGEKQRTKTKIIFKPN